MVIQRSWVLSHQSSDRSSITQASSSDDSNSSWNTQSNSTSSGPQRTTSTTNSSHSVRIYTPPPHTKLISICILQFYFYKSECIHKKFS